MFSLVFALMMTTVVVMGPMWKAIEIKDWMEIGLDIVLIAFFWGAHFMLTNEHFWNIMHRIFH